jgi:hypothetical protein
MSKPARARLVALWIVALLLFSGGASADRGRAAALYAEAQRAERDLRFAEALARYREAFDADPSAPTAPGARRRATYLAARAEGDFQPLTTLERSRRSPEPARDRAALEALAGEAGGFPAGRVRSEARLFCAGRWLDDLGDPGRAIPLLHAVAADEAADPLSRSLAVTELVRARRMTGDLRGAVEDVDRWESLATPELRSRVHREWRRIPIRWASVALLALLGIAGVLAGARIVRREGTGGVVRAAARPMIAVFALYLGAVGGALTYGYDGTTPAPFLILAGGVLGLALVARVWSAASAPAEGSGRRRQAAWLRAAACALGVLAVGFLALEVIEPRYLDGFGL